MACDPQSILDAMGCGYCGLSEDELLSGIVALTCVLAGGIAPDQDVIVIGGEGDDIIIGGEDGGMIGAE